MAATALRSVQLGLVGVVAFLSVVVSAAGNGDNEAGAMVAGIPTRHLLQTVQPCPVDFATQNYSVVTSVCNATNPNMPVCCQAFVEFACPFASYINDANTNCNVAMFTYLNMAGGYPEQMFTTCQGDANGLPCPVVPEPSPNPSSATMDMPWRLSSLVILLVTLVHLVRYS
ncbi:hypothetical protein KC19_4G194500 [Ceratodon purpureus]|uniref:GPI-anchored protein LLG1-like domain-containing protein n=1 Tax=Ceratodon purpureus TaxID=3225 RepID=A0A8T0ICQ9_CERPU|nr:hypothetical protein KC19_4G194500 [Ceratodon purpureus]